MMDGYDRDDCKIPVKDSLDMGRLRDGHGQEFEVDEDRLNEEGEPDVAYVEFLHVLGFVFYLLYLKPFAMQLMC